MATLRTNDTMNDKGPFQFSLMSLMILVTVASVIMSFISSLGFVVAYFLMVAGLPSIAFVAYSFQACNNHRKATAFLLGILGMPALVVLYLSVFHRSMAPFLLLLIVWGPQFLILWEARPSRVTRSLRSRPQSQRRLPDKLPEPANDAEKGSAEPFPPKVCGGDNA